MFVGGNSRGRGRDCTPIAHKENTRVCAPLMLGSLPRPGRPAAAPASVRCPLARSRSPSSSCTSLPRPPATKESFACSIRLPSAPRSFVHQPTKQARRCATWSATHTVRTTHLSSAAPRDPINCMTAVCASPANDQGPLSRVRVDSDSATAVGACSSVCPPVFQWPSPLLATRPPRPPCRASSTNTVA